ELVSHPLLARLTLEREAPLPVLPADVREAQEVERLRLALSSPLAIPSGIPPELDQARLLGLQLQSELPHPLAQLFLEPLRVLAMLEAHDEVVRVAHDHHIAARLSPPPPLGPKVEGVVQVHVGQQRRYRCPLRCPFFALRPDLVLHDPRLQPALDQPEDPPVPDPVLDKPPQPTVIQAGEEVADVRVEHPVHLLPLDPYRQ